MFVLNRTSYHIFEPPCLVSEYPHATSYCSPTARQLHTLCVYVAKWPSESIQRIPDSDIWRPNIFSHCDRIVERAVRSLISDDRAPADGILSIYNILVLPRPR